MPAGTEAGRVAGMDVLVDADGLAFARYGAVPGTTLLIRPDGHVAARFAQPDAAALGAAHDRALSRATLARLAA